MNAGYDCDLHLVVEVAFTTSEAAICRKAAWNGFGSSSSFSKFTEVVPFFSLVVTVCNSGVAMSITDAEIAFPFSHTGPLHAGSGRVRPADRSADIV